MTRKKQMKQDEKVGLTLTGGAEALLEDRSASPNRLLNRSVALPTAPPLCHPRRPDDLDGYVAAEANQTRRRSSERLDAIFSKILRHPDRHDDERK